MMQDETSAKSCEQSCSREKSLVLGCNTLAYRKGKNIRTYEQINNEHLKTENKFVSQLSMGKPEYTICVGSVVQDSSFPLQKSNKVTVDSTLFRPFSLFCYSHVHSRVARWPNRGCCAVADMLG